MGATVSAAAFIQLRRRVRSVELPERGSFVQFAPFQPENLKTRNAIRFGIALA